MTSDPTASIVIPTLAAPRYLDVALASVMPQARELGAEVIVVCDGPDAVAAEVVQRHGATLIILPAQQGLNTGRNTGIEASTGELIVFIDQDIDAPPGWLAALDPRPLGGRATELRPRNGSHHHPGRGSPGLRRGARMGGQHGDPAQRDRAPGRL